MIADVVGSTYPDRTCPGRMGGGPVEGNLLRQTMGRFTTGVAVVTCGTSEEPHGMTVNSVTSISLDPPLILVSLTSGARSTAALKESRRFAVSVLCATQEELALRFARRGEDHFSGLELEYGCHQVPVVPHALAHVECDTERELDGGDHVIFLGRAVRCCHRDGEPLTFHAGRFGRFARGEDHGTHWFF